MTVDKNLFLYDLSIVAIAKNEAPYIKEWLDYHLLAGVQHFYIYDNESSDNFKEVLQPYIDREIVTYTFFPGVAFEAGVGRQKEAYNDAIRKYRFFSRYMAFIDIDEFILPRKNATISETVDEILNDNPNAKGLLVHWHCFGDNGQEKADYSRGVLERFTRRAPNDWAFILKDPVTLVGNLHLKTINNPRYVKQVVSAHFSKYYEGCFGVNEQGTVVDGVANLPVF